jgi:deoxycytidine triphosphate deaminase
MSPNHDTRKSKRTSELSLLPDVHEALPSFSGVLLSDMIRKCVLDFKMIQPFHEDQLRAASYDLTIGDEVAIGGKAPIVLKDCPGENEFELAPFDVAVIKINETLNLPRNIIGRWNIKVSRAYQGLVWVGGPQVDPGWVGNLCCPVYNLSAKSVFLRLHDKIAVIDFVITTPFIDDKKQTLGKGECKKFPRPPKRVLFDDYVSDKLASALISGAKDRLDGFESKLKEMEGRLTFFVVLTFTLIAILVAALSILVTSTNNPSTGAIALPTWVYVNNALALLAIGLSVASFFRPRAPGLGGDAGVARNVLHSLWFVFIFGGLAWAAWTLFLPSNRWMAPKPQSEVQSTQHTSGSAAPQQAEDKSRSGRSPDPSAMSKPAH